MFLILRRREINGTLVPRSNFIPFFPDLDKEFPRITIVRTQQLHFCKILADMKVLFSKFP